METTFAFGKTGLTVDLPDGPEYQVIHAHSAGAIANVRGALEAALDAPIGGVPLLELAKGKKTAAISICDITRPAPNRVTLPPLLDRLHRAGMRAEDITLCIATGLHRVATDAELEIILGPEIAGKYPILNHDAKRKENHRYVGETGRGTPVWIEQRFLDADLHITLGFVEQHLMLGFSGGRKMIAPGLAAQETIKVIHSPKFMRESLAVEGSIDENPLHAELLEIARMARHDFIVDVTLTRSREISGIFAGDPVMAHAAAVDFLRSSSVEYVPELVDAVITSAAGNPLDLTFYQTIKGVTAAQHILKPGGKILVLSECPEGIGSPEFAEMLRGYGGAQDFLDEIRDTPVVPDQWQLEKLALVEVKHPVFFYAPGTRPEQLGSLGARSSATASDAVATLLAGLPVGAKVALIPDGPYAYARVKPAPAPSLREAASGIFNASLAACSVEQAFASKMTVEAGVIRLEDGEEIDLAGIERVVVIAMGKGATPMLEALLQRLPLPEGCAVSGVLDATRRPEYLPDGMTYFAGGHPTPNEASIAAAEASLELIREASRERNTFCFFLISGGASAMMELPLDPSITLADTIAFYQALVHSGASITEINCVRKHFSAIKGGRLGLAAAGLPSLTILVSDVPSGHLDALASGPTLPDTSTVERCHEIIARYGLMERFPESLRRFFASEMLVETPKPDEMSPRVLTLLSSDDLAAEAQREAERLGFATVIDNTCDDWDYRLAAEYLLKRLEELRAQHGRVCLISSGEVTVTLPPVSEVVYGAGGRNQHFALYAATKIAGDERKTAVFSAGSDGIDGNSDCAGALIDQHTLSGAKDVAEAEDALRRFDSHAMLHRLNATIYTGPTGNNLRDLRLLLAE